MYIRQITEQCTIIKDMCNYRIVLYFLFIGKLVKGHIKTCTYSGFAKCNTSLALDTAAIIDINVTMDTEKPGRDTYHYVFYTGNTSFFEFKALDNDDIGNVETFISGTVVHNMTFKYIPNYETVIDVNGTVTLTVNLDKCITKSNNINLLRLLAFKYGNEPCHSSETRCSNATRCVHPRLTCDYVYDFCHNNFLNCQNNSGTTTYKRNKRTSPPSVRGILLGCICLTALLSFLIYIIACRKRPCCKRVAQKLCGLLPEERRRGRAVPNVQYTRGNDQIDLHANRFQEPPPSYADIEHCYTNSTAHVQPRSEAGSRSLNIPPPLYSCDNIASNDNTENEMPPPYTAVPDGMQHM